jgi:hypothetical protein
MMRSTRRLLVTATCALLLLTGLEVAAEASSGTRAGVAVQAHRSGAACPAGRKTRLARPRLAAVSVPGGVQFAWGCTRGAKRYRVAWAAAPYGKWPGKRSYVSGWLPKSARSSTFAVSAVPHSGDFMLGVQYANPVYGQLEVKNARGRVRRSTGWVPVFPTPPDPGPGDALRVGTYNVMGAPAGVRANAIAANISSHGLGIVALQEADANTGQAIVGALGGDWVAVPYSNSPEQILYRASTYRVLSSGLFDVHNAKISTPLATPWARFALVNGSAGSRPFYVVSSHVTENAAKGVMERKAEAGVEARDMIAGINRVNTGGDPVVLGADLHYLREPWSDVPGYVEAPPTLIREGGYYDAMAAVSKFNIAYSTFNGGNGTTAPAQQYFNSGVAPRADYIMLKGFRGSSAYVNVPNWSWNGVTPSDHNLVYADVVVPFR